MQCKPHWHPRGDGILYMLRGQLCLRSYPAAYRDRKSAAQLCQRTKFLTAQRFLLPLQKLLARGFSPGEKPNGRRVGAFHMALGATMRDAVECEGGECRIVDANVALTDGSVALPAALQISRGGVNITVSWRHRKSLDAGFLLFAARNDDSGELFADALELSRAAVSIELPPAWRDARLAFWIAFVSADGRMRTATRFGRMAPGSPSTTSLILLISFWGAISGDAFACAYSASAPRDAAMARQGPHRLSRFNRRE